MEDLRKENEELIR